MTPYKQITDLTSGWWVNIKNTIQTITAKWTFNSAINLVPGADPAAPVNGDTWINSVANTIKARLNGISKTLITVESNAGLASSSEKILSSLVDGTVSNQTGIVSMFNVDSDVATALNGATYTNKVATISPANSKTFYEGQIASPQAGTLYIALSDNYAFKIS